MKKLLRTRKDRQQFNDWVIALESGVFKQCRGELQNRKGFCCLGLACALTIPENDLIIYRDGEGLMKGGDPSNQPFAHTWLINVNDDYKARTGYSLVTLNDDFKYSFEQIAAGLRKAYKDEM